MADVNIFIVFEQTNGTAKDRRMRMKWLFSITWKRWLWNEHNQQYDKVIEVKGWRTALVDRRGGGRITMSPCFKILGFRFD